MTKYILIIILEKYLIHQGHSYVQLDYDYIMRNDIAVNIFGVLTFMMKVNTFRLECLYFDSHRYFALTILELYCTYSQVTFSYYDKGLLFGLRAAYYYK